MPKILTYPHYTPDRRTLRSYLLVYDEISTIVPQIDQGHVSVRDHWREIADVSKEKALRFIDPTFRNSEWFAQPISVAAFEDLIRKVSERPNIKQIVRSMSVDGYGYLVDTKDRTHERSLLEAGWAYLALEKFPRNLVGELSKARLAFRTTSNQHEMNPVLIQPHLSDFIISRLARSISEKEKLTPVTTSKRNVDTFLLDGEITQRGRRSELLAVSLDLAIPQKIENLCIGDFWDMRESFKQVRKRLNLMMDEFLVELELDDMKDVQRFRTQVADHRADIEHRIMEAEKQIDVRGRTNLTIDVIVQMSAAGLGAAIGGVPGAMIGSGIAPIVSKYGQLISTRSQFADVDCVEQLALIRSKIRKQVRREEYKRPFYYL